MAVWIIVGILVLLVVSAIVIYNGLITSRNRVDEAWSDITVQMKRRFDLIPNLVNTVKGYAKHETSVFEKVTAARANALSAQTVQETAKAENQFQTALKSLFAVSENYPTLRASENFQQLQAELVDTEDKIQAARRFYNGSARDYNTKLQTFPTNTFANMFHFTRREFFDVDAAESAAVGKAVDVNFDEKDA